VLEAHRRSEHGKIPLQGYLHDALQILDRIIRERHKMVTDAEVLQEIMHRYTAISRREAIQPAFDCLLGLVDEVYPVTAQHTEAAKTILLARHRLQSRDAIHIAIMQDHGSRQLLSFDRGYDSVPGLERLVR
jgi:predicted nucleic acid-binding protein